MVECEYAHQTIHHIEHHRFNRYMVECEYSKSEPGKIDNVVLIDTWWNVNNEKDVTNAKPVYRF